ncbi:MAG: hypothetical protein JWM78_1737 [Verrucomicrobiaceae bacterium]|nr:hypothetical protein [Verrucomicrobiaceae bacterium]
MLIESTDNDFIEYISQMLQLYNIQTAATNLGNNE